MAAKKDDVTTYTKAELIKALRASVAREAKLQKRIAALETVSQPPLKPRLVLHTETVVPEDQAPPAFPWDVK